MNAEQSVWASSGKALAVKRVTENRGKRKAKTAGHPNHEGPRNAGLTPIEEGVDFLGQNLRKLWR